MKRKVYDLLKGEIKVENYNLIREQIEREQENERILDRVIQEVGKTS